MLRIETRDKAWRQTHLSLLLRDTSSHASWVWSEAHRTKGPATCPDTCLLLQSHETQEFGLVQNTVVIEVHLSSLRIYNLRASLYWKNLRTWQRASKVEAWRSEGPQNKHRERLIERMNYQLVPIEVLSPFDSKVLNIWWASSSAPPSPNLALSKGKTTWTIWRKHGRGKACPRMVARWNAGSHRGNWLPWLH